MKCLCLLVSLLPLLAQFPWSQPQEPPKKEEPVKGWSLVSYFSVPPTRYSRVEKGVIKAESLGTRSSLFKGIGEKEKNFPILSWRWKISNVVRSAIETKEDRFDAAARVMVVFGREQPFQLFQGGDPVGFRIEYLWASRLPRGHVFDHPGEKGCKVFVIESGDGKAGQWVSEERNLHRDFRTAFGKDPPGLFAIGLQTDTDHSNESVTAYYSEPLLKKR